MYKEIFLWLEKNVQIAESGRCLKHRLDVSVASVDLPLLRQLTMGKAERAINARFVGTLPFWGKNAPVVVQNPIWQLGGISHEKR